MRIQKILGTLCLIGGGMLLSSFGSLTVEQPNCSPKINIAKQLYFPPGIYRSPQLRNGKYMFFSFSNKGGLMAFISTTYEDANNPSKWISTGGYEVKRGKIYCSWNDGSSNEVSVISPTSIMYMDNSSGGTVTYKLVYQY